MTQVLMIIEVSQFQSKSKFKCKSIRFDSIRTLLFPFFLGVLRESVKKKEGEKERERGIRD